MVVMSVIEGLLVIVGVLIGVAFITLCERKILGYVQIRSGPNSVGVMGVFQPFSDAIKLFTSEMILLEVSNYYIYYVSCGMGLFLMLLIWYTMPWGGVFLEYGFGLILFMCILSVGVYSLLGAGWASNSKYGLLGGLRAVAQTISYEVSFALIMISVVLMVGGYNLGDFSAFSLSFILFFPLLSCWLVSLLAELNRTPFDFAEGESELVSGFNIEYSGAGFAIIFMAEYGMILLLGAMTVVLFGGWGGLLGLGLAVGVSCWVIGVRGAYPRYRYDKLMMLAWSGILPIILCLFLTIFGGVLVF